MSVADRPAWAAKYLAYSAWTHDEFRNLLCGLPPHPHTDTPLADEDPVPSRQQANDAFVRDELLRTEADRHMRDAIAAGGLKVLGPIDDAIIEKVSPHLTPEEVQTLRHALTHDRACAKTYVVSPEVAVRWAERRPQLFPRFPFRRAQGPHGIDRDRATGRTEGASKSLGHVRSRTDAHIEGETL
jgi:hypothetical protein